MVRKKSLFAPVKRLAGKIFSETSYNVSNGMLIPTKATIPVLHRSLLVPLLETMSSEAVSLGLGVNWQKTKVQDLGCREDMPLTIKVQG